MNEHIDLNKNFSHPVDTIQQFQLLLDKIKENYPNNYPVTFSCHNITGEADDRFSESYGSMAYVMETSDKTGCHINLTSLHIKN